VIHGIVATRYPVFARGIRMISVPNLVGSLLYTATAAVILAPPTWLPGGWPAAAVWGIWLAGCCVLSLACGVARERWGSVWAAAVLHAISAVVVWWSLPHLV
jgi:predicted Abi (CAAX) family protease